MIPQASEPARQFLIGTKTTDFKFIVAVLFPRFSPQGALRSPFPAICGHSGYISTGQWRGSQGVAAAARSIGGGKDV